MLRYADLHVIDAAGRELPASIAARGEGLAIRFDDTGAAYPVVVDPTMWTEQQELTPPDPDQKPDEFGLAVAVNGDTALVGSPAHADAGYGLRLRPLRHGLELRAGAPRATARRRARCSAARCAVSVETAVIGAPGQNGADGAAYVFVRSGGAWAQQQAAHRHRPGEGRRARHGGRRSSGDTAIVGAPGDAGAPGAAFVFVRSGTTWTLEQALTQGTLPRRRGGRRVRRGGRREQRHGDRRGARHGSPGSAYVFVRSGTAWSLEQALGAANAGSGRRLRCRGRAGGGHGRRRIAEINSAYVFTRSGAAWTQAQRLIVDSSTRIPTCRSR